MPIILAIMGTFACTIGFVAFALISADVLAHRLRRVAVIHALLAIVCVWGIAASADLTRQGFENLETT